MELPGRRGDWLDTDTVTVQGSKLRLDTTSKGWGSLLGHLRGLSHGHGHLHQGLRVLPVPAQGSTGMSGPNDRAPRPGSGGPRCPTGSPPARTPPVSKRSVTGLDQKPSRPSSNDG